MEYSKQAKRAISGASKLSKSLQHSYVGTEHILISIIEQENSLAAKVLNSNGVDKQALLKLVEELISPGGDVVIRERDGYTPKMEQLLDHAADEAEKCNSKTIGTEHLLLAMIRMQDCSGARLLNSLDVNPHKLFSELVAGLGAEGTVYKEEMQAINNGRARKNEVSYLNSDIKSIIRRLDLNKDGRIELFEIHALFGFPNCVYCCPYSSCSICGVCYCDSCYSESPCIACLRSR